MLPPSVVAHSEAEAHDADIGRIVVPKSFVVHAPAPPVGFVLVLIVVEEPRIPNATQNVVDAHATALR